VFLVLVTRRPSANLNDLAGFNARLGSDCWLSFITIGLSPNQKRLALLGARPRSLAPTCFWHQSLLRRRRAKSAEGMGVKCIGPFGHFCLLHFKVIIISLGFMRIHESGTKASLEKMNAAPQSLDSREQLGSSYHALLWRSDTYK